MRLRVQRVHEEVGVRRSLAVPPIEPIARLGGLRLSSLAGLRQLVACSSLAGKARSRDPNREERAVMANWSSIGKLRRLLCRSLDLSHGLEPAVEQDVERVIGALAGVQGQLLQWICLWQDLDVAEAGVRHRRLPCWSSGQEDGVGVSLVCVACRRVVEARCHLSVG